MKTVPAALAATAAVLLLFTSTVTAKTKTTKSRSQAHTSGPASRPQAPAAQPGTFEFRVEDYIRQSGYQFQKVKANSWFLLTPGKEMNQMRVILGAGPSSIAMGAVVLQKQNLKLTAEGLEKLMKLSYDLNYVRVCIDSDGDLLVMAQLKDPWLNAAEFKSTVNLVTAAADRAYAVMRPYLSTP